MNKKIKISRIVFCVVTVIIFIYVSELLKPNWFDFWNNDNTVKGFYELPKNSVEVAFIGTSGFITSISPVYLYENYGIRSYDFATEQQPLLASYYILQEIYRYDSESLKVVVLDPTSLDLVKDYKKEFCEKALINLRPSLVKMKAFLACQEEYENFEAVDYYLPIIRYHSRWQELGTWDHWGFKKTHNILCTMGQNVIPFTDIDGDAIDVINPSLTHAIDYSSDAYTWDKSEQKYIYNIVSFCREKGISIYFANTPSARMSDLFNDEISSLSYELGVEYLNMNYISVLDDMGFDTSSDVYDRNHPNYFGSIKCSEYVGQWLTKKVEDGELGLSLNVSNAYYDKQIGKYHEYVNGVLGQ